MPMTRQPIKFGEWKPDYPGRLAPSTEAKGVLAQQQTYVPFPSPLAYGNVAAESTVIGGAGFYDNLNAAQIFLGTTSKLYQIQSGVLTDVSKTGGYAVGSDRFWVFAQFGNNLVAICKGVTPQLFDMTNGVSNPKFADLSGSPPQFETIGRIKNFLVGGLGTALSWSGANVITTWTPDPVTQAGTTTLDSAGGDIKAIIGGETGTIFQQRQISRMTYVGPPTIWDIQVVEDKRGALAQQAAVKVGRNIYYVSEDGFFIFDGYQSTPIGQDSVDQFFAANINYAYRHRICAAYDAESKCVMFAFPSGGSQYPSHVMLWSISGQKWTHDDINLEYVFDMPRPGYNLETLYTYPGAQGGGNIDLPSLAPISIDSPVFLEGRKSFAGADTSHNLVTFTGPNRPAILETQEVELAPGQRATVSELWPIVDADVRSLSASLRYRSAAPGQNIQETQISVANSIGMCPVLADARFLRGRIYVAQGASWTHAEGMHAKFRLSGMY